MEDVPAKITMEPHFGIQNKTANVMLANVIIHSISNGRTNDKYSQTELDNRGGGGRGGGKKEQEEQVKGGEK